MTTVRPPSIIFARNGTVQTRVPELVRNSRYLPKSSTKFAPRMNSPSESSALLRRTFTAQPRQTLSPRIQSQELISKTRPHRSFTPPPHLPGFPSFDP